MRKILHTVRFKLITAFFGFSVPLIIILVINNFYAINLVRKQVIKSNQNIVNLYMDQIDSNLEVIDQYLYRNRASNPDLINLDQSSEVNSQSYNLSKLQLLNQLTRDIGNYKELDMLFVYSGINDDLMTVQTESIDFNAKKLIEQEIKKFLSDNTSLQRYEASKWNSIKIDENYYLIRALGVGNVFMGAWIEIDQLMVNASLLEFGTNGRSLFVTNQYEPMFDQDFVKEYTIDLQFVGGESLLSGTKDKFIVIGQMSNKGDFGLVSLIQDSVILERLPYIQKFLTIYMPLIVLIFGMLFLYLIRKTVLRPINRIVKAMLRVKSGDWDAHVDHRNSSNEFVIMTDTFNSMVANIKELKIEVYEEQIAIQNAEMKHLRLQINPHFFLNSINMIYQLAIVKDFATIKEMAACLVEYFRFMYRDNSTFILLDEEIKHTENYLRIQEMRFAGYLTHYISIPDGLAKYLVPPLIIQSFVENSIKYAVTMDDVVNIVVQADIEGTLDHPIIKITISDTGPGFSQDVLTKLQQEDTIAYAGENVGIWNIRRRLHLLYKGEADIKFFNDEQSGAVVEIYLPLKMEF